ncbi:hypothetical protein [Actinomadura sp. DC4]|uniref:hypothetical protein n=1 Tax=Actinomadura sp. DC4 TaxID=3055069 RepID=UPI0025AFA97B|nr:hypothetical protein [Actinomadura sp. DC4]MDN3354758.1 hypothetical protein [Actinomadura sp. DC4]
MTGSPAPFAPALPAGWAARRVPAGVWVFEEPEPAPARAAELRWPVPEPARPILVVDGRGEPALRAADAAVRSLIDEGAPRRVRLLFPGLSPQAAQRFADRHGLDVVATSGALRIGRTHLHTWGFDAARPTEFWQWFRFVPGRRPEPFGAVYPLPEWEALLVGSAVPSRLAGLVPCRIAAGLALVPDGLTDVAFLRYAAEIQPDPARLTVAASGPPSVLNAVESLLAALPGMRRIRIVCPDLARSPGVRDLARRYGAELLAPDTELVRTRAGALIATGPESLGHWVRTTADGRTESLGALHPVPFWRPALREVLAGSRDLRETPSGVRLPRPTGSSTARLAAVVPPSPERPTILADGDPGRPGDRAAVERVIALLPPELRTSFRLVMANAEAGGPRAYGQWLANRFGALIAVACDIPAAAWEPTAPRVPIPAPAWQEFAPEEHPPFPPNRLLDHQAPALPPNAPATPQPIAEPPGTPAPVAGLGAPHRAPAAAIVPGTAPDSVAALMTVTRPDTARTALGSSTAPARVTDPGSLAAPATVPPPETAPKYPVIPAMSAQSGVAPGSFVTTATMSPPDTAPTVPGSVAAAAPDTAAGFSAAPAALPREAQVRLVSAPPPLGTPPPRHEAEASPGPSAATPGDGPAARRAEEAKSRPSGPAPIAAPATTREVSRHPGRRPETAPDALPPAPPEPGDVPVWPPTAGPGRRPPRRPGDVPPLPKPTAGPRFSTAPATHLSPPALPTPAPPSDPGRRPPRRSDDTSPFPTPTAGPRLTTTQAPPTPAPPTDLGQRPPRQDDDTAPLPTPTAAPRLAVAQAPPTPASSVVPPSASPSRVATPPAAAASLATSPLTSPAVSPVQPGTAPGAPLSNPVLPPPVAPTVLMGAPSPADPVASPSSRPPAPSQPPPAAPGLATPPPTAAGLATPPPTRSPLATPTPTTPQVTGPPVPPVQSDTGSAAPAAAPVPPPPPLAPALPPGAATPVGSPPPSPQRSLPSGQPPVQASPARAGSGVRQVVVVPLVPRAHRTDPDERRLYRERIGTRRERHMVAVTRVMTERPALRAAMASESDDAVTTDLSALRAYLSGDLPGLDAALRAGDAGGLPADAGRPRADAEGLRADVACCVSGLRLLAAYRGPAYRTADLTDDEAACHSPGDVLAEPGFTAATARRPRQEGNALYAIWSRTARRVAPLSGGDDPGALLFAAGTAFTVLASARENDRWVIHLDERNRPGQGDGALTEADRTVLRRLHEAETEPADDAPRSHGAPLGVGDRCRYVPPPS